LYKKMEALMIEKKMLMQMRTKRLKRQFMNCRKTALTSELTA